ncbi:MAG: type II methionyl aminopeptidase [Candidatus Pacearchaeota archaeon]|jgi:methionyl aminopeptidase
MDNEKILKAGRIAKEVVEFAKSIIKKDKSLLEIAEDIENKVFELGGEPAFPVNLSINSVAAHFTPFHDDKTLAYGLLKVDIGVHVQGNIADTAFSIDLENSEVNKKLILSTENALQEAIKISKNGISVNEIGKKVTETIEAEGFSPIVNLGGHGLKEYEAHAEPFIPNVDNHDLTKLKNGLFAIEPFATNGNGRVHDGQPHGIYILMNNKNIRSPIAREVLKFIEEEYPTLPFASRWIVKKFGAKALFGLNQLEQNENIHHFPQLIETGKGIVAQAEHTILINNQEVKVTTR